MIPIEVDELRPLGRLFTRPWADVVTGMQVDGSGLRQILPKGTQTGQVSPDGKRLYYWQVSASNGHTSIASSDLTGQHIVRLSSPACPRPRA